MSLRIVKTNDERVVPTPVEKTLRDAVSSHGRAVLLVPSFAAQLAVSKALAEMGGLSLGVTVTTPSAWVKERWEVWGDGSHVIEGVARTIAMEQTLDTAPSEARGAVEANPGTVRVLSSLARYAYPWLPLDPSGEPDRIASSLLHLSDAEVAAVGLVGSYARLIHDMGYVEESEAAGRVVARLAEEEVTPPAFMVTGFSSMPRTQRELIVDLSCHTSVTLVSVSVNPQASLLSERMLARIVESAGVYDVDVSLEEDQAPRSTERHSELSSVLGQLFSGDKGTTQAEGAVSLLRPAGPLAEAELVAQHVERLASAGARRVVVSVPDADRAWRELAPKLHAREIDVGAELSTPLSKLEAGRAFSEYITEVANLAELASTWPAAQPVEKGVLVTLGNMDWWPPRDLTDFLLSDIAHVPTERAQQLDAAWRSDRLLSPQDVLDALQNARLTSPQVALATRELLRGRIGSAASKLLAPYVGHDGAPLVDDVVFDDEGNVALSVERHPDALADALAVGVLGGILNVAGTLKELGLTADPAAERRCELKTLVSLTVQALGEVSLVVRPSAPSVGATCEVELLPASRAASLAPLSADAVVSCGQTSEESPVGTGDDVLTAMLASLGVETEASPLDEARASFVSLASVPRHHLSLERTLVDASSKDSYPSVMLTEVMACYGLDADDDAPKVGMEVLDRGEDRAVENVSDAGVAPQSVATEACMPAGSVGPSARGLILVPPMGRRDLVDGRPLLSASQIESYLECPYKWFSLRRLGLGDVDAGFSSMEMGTFAHRVLECAHRSLLDEAVAAMVASGLERPDLDLDPTIRIPGSRVSEDDPASLEHGHEVVGRMFDEHQTEQFIQRGRRSASQALVPHTAEDEGHLHSLRSDLISEIDYEAGLFRGFEPRFFEWSFGRQGDLVPYADVYLTGTVDRMDVDAHGQVVVIDYKHKSPANFSKEYGVFGPEGYEVEKGFSLPRRVQSLIYGQIARRRFPELKVVAAVYLGSRGTHALAGAVSDNAVVNVFGTHAPSDQTLKRMTVDDREGFGCEESQGMDALLDATEDAIREKVHELLDGNIEARPLDKDACTYCPVMNCERRLG